MDTDVAPDGSPVAVYLALPARPEFTPVLDHVGPGTSVLDLGCGVGRLANELAARGCEVTGVDESQAMLDHVQLDVRAVRASLEGLDLGRRFDVVVLASHLVNVADVDQRHAFLRAAADHVASTGVIMIQHWEVPPALPTDRQADIAGVRVELRVLATDGPSFDGRVTYTVGERSWEQTFRATLLDDQQLDVELARAGLVRDRRLSPTWLTAVPAGAAL